MGTGGLSVGTVILYGSPHGAKGDTAALVEAFCAQLGDECFWVDAYHANIGPCVDCRACWQKDGCVLQDDMAEVYRQIAASQVVVIASPVYFSLLTGPLMTVGSRLQALYAASRFRGKRLTGRPKAGIVLLAGGGDGKPDHALDAARRLLRQMGAEYIGCAASLRTDTIPARLDTAALEAAAGLARQAKAWVACHQEQSGRQ